MKIIKRLKGYFLLDNNYKRIGGPYKTRQEARWNMEQINKRKASSTNVSEEVLKDIDTAYVGMEDFFRYKEPEPGTRHQPKISPLDDDRDEMGVTKKHKRNTPMLTESIFDISPRNYKEDYPTTGLISWLSSHDPTKMYDKETVSSEIYSDTVPILASIVVAHDKICNKAYARAYPDYTVEVSLTKKDIENHPIFKEIINSVKPIEQKIFELKQLLSDLLIDKIFKFENINVLDAEIKEEDIVFDIDEIQKLFESQKDSNIRVAASISGNILKDILNHFYAKYNIEESEVLDVSTTGEPQTETIPLSQADTEEESDLLESPSVETKEKKETEKGQNKERIDIKNTLLKNTLPSVYNKLHDEIELLRTIIRTNQQRIRDIASDKLYLNYKFLFDIIDTFISKYGVIFILNLEDELKALELPDEIIFVLKEIDGGSEEIWKAFHKLHFLKDIPTDKFLSETELNNVLKETNALAESSFPEALAIIREEQEKELKNLLNLDALRKNYKTKMFDAEQQLSTLFLGDWKTIVKDLIAKVSQKSTIPVEELSNTELISLIKEILSKDPKYESIYTKYPIEEQEKLVNFIVKYIKDFNAYSKIDFLARKQEYKKILQELENIDKSIIEFLVTAYKNKLSFFEVKSKLIDMVKNLSKFIPPPPLPENASEEDKIAQNKKIIEIKEEKADAVRTVERLLDRLSTVAPNLFSL